MSAIKIFLCLLCACGSAAGQILMKASSVAWKEAGNFYDFNVLLIISSAFFIYFMSSLGWVYILKGLPLTVAYPFLAITFLLVPIAGHFFFNESVNWRHGIAALLIISGICIISLTRNPT